MVGSLITFSAIDKGRLFQISKYLFIIFFIFLALVPFIGIEVKGSKILNKSSFKSISCYNYVLDYPEISAITQRNKNKVSVFANQYIDIEALIEHGFIKLNELILGQWKTGIPSYSEYSKNQYEVLNLIDDLDEKKYYKLLLDRCLDI